MTQTHQRKRKGTCLYENITAFVCNVKEVGAKNLPIHGGMVEQIIAYVYNEILLPERNYKKDGF